MKEKKEWRPLPESITIKESKIEGLGVFATQDIQEKTDLGISHVYDERFPDNYIRLPLGAFINHHEMPNCKAVVSESHESIGNIFADCEDCEGLCFVLVWSRRRRRRG